MREGKTCHFMALNSMNVRAEHSGSKSRKKGLVVNIVSVGHSSHDLKT